MTALYLVSILALGQAPAQTPVEPPDDPKAWSYVEPCWVYYPAVFEKDLPRKDFEKQVRSALDHVASTLGTWPGTAHIIVRTQVQDDDKVFRRGLTRARWTTTVRSIWVQHYDFYGRPYLVEERISERHTTVHAFVAKSEIRDDLLRHELAHAWIALKGYDIPGWLNEGIAHYLETKDGFNPTLAKILKESSRPSETELTTLPRFTKNENLLRAASWAQVYHLRSIGWSLEEILRVQTPYALQPCIATVLKEQERRDAIAVTSK